MTACDTCGDRFPHRSLGGQVCIPCPDCGSEVPFREADWV